MHSWFQLFSNIFFSFHFSFHILAALFPPWAQRCSTSLLTYSWGFKLCHFAIQYLLPQWEYYSPGTSSAHRLFWKLWLGNSLHQIKSIPMHDASIFGRVSIAGPIVSLGSDLCVPVWERLPPESPCQNSEVIILRTSSSTAARQDETKRLSPWRTSVAWTTDFILLPPWIPPPLFHL